MSSGGEEEACTGLDMDKHAMNQQQEIKRIALHDLPERDVFS